MPEWLYIGEGRIVNTAHVELIAHTDDGQGVEVWIKGDEDPYEVKPGPDADYLRALIERSERAQKGG